MSNTSSRDVRPELRPATSSGNLKPPKRFGGGRSRSGSADLERLGSDRSGSRPSSFDSTAAERPKTPTKDTSDNNVKPSSGGFSRFLHGGSRRRKKRDNKRKVGDSSPSTTMLNSDNSNEQQADPSNGNSAAASFVNESQSREDPDAGTILTDDSDLEQCVYR